MRVVPAPLCRAPHLASTDETAPGQAAAAASDAARVTTNSTGIYLSKRDFIAFFAKVRTPARAPSLHAARASARTDFLRVPGLRLDSGHAGCAAS
jgi:hypothetical protein